MTITKIRKIADTRTLENEKLTFLIVQLILETAKIEFNVDSSQDNFILVFGHFYLCMRGVMLDRNQLGLDLILQIIHLIFSPHLSR